jgi:hypothetical protein
MANQESESNDVLTKVARTVGAALGTVASAAAEISGSKPEDAAQPAQSKSRKRASTNDAQARAHERMKAKRAKHRRKLHRKTAG